MFAAYAGERQSQRPFLFLLLLALLAILWTRQACAQAQGSPNPGESSQERQNSPGAARAPEPGLSLQHSAGSDSPQRQQDQENPKRILGIIPNFTTTNDTPLNQPPLTSREKYVLSLHQMFDFSAHIGNAFQSAIQQASDGQPHYGQGWGAYGKRFGASEGDQISSSFFIFGLLPSVLKEDPRYFRRGTGSAWSRIEYAATRTVITRKDDSRPAFNAPQVLGQLLSGSVSTAYYPQRDRSAGGVFVNWAVNLAYTSGYNVLREYYPDLLRALFHRRSNAAVQAPSGKRPENSVPGRQSTP